MDDPNDTTCISAPTQRPSIIHARIEARAIKGRFTGWRLCLTFKGHVLPYTELCNNIPAKFRESPSKSSAFHPKTALWHNILASHTQNLAGMFLHDSVLCRCKNVLKGCVIKTTTHATFDHVFCLAEYRLYATRRAEKSSSRFGEILLCVLGFHKI